MNKEQMIEYYNNVWKNYIGKDISDECIDFFISNFDKLKGSYEEQKELFKKKL